MLKCQLRDFVERNPGYTSFLAQRQGLSVSDSNLAGGTSPSDSSYATAGGRGGGGQGNTDEGGSAEAGQGPVVFWERSVGSRLAEMFRCVSHGGFMAVLRRTRLFKSGSLWFARQGFCGTGKWVF